METIYANRRHRERRVYISDKEGNRIVFHKADKYSEVTDTFVARRTEGGEVLVDKKGLCSEDIFDEIGYESLDNRHSRPVKIHKEGNNWTYCTYKDGEMEVEYPYYCKTEDGKSYKLGVRFGSRGFYCLEYNAPGKKPTYILCFYTENNGRTVLWEYKFIELQYGECSVLGITLDGLYMVFCKDIHKKDMAIFDQMPIHSRNEKYWGGLYKGHWWLYDFGRNRRYKKECNDNDVLEYNEEMQVFIVRQESVITEIWDITWEATNLMKNSILWEDAGQMGDKMYAVDYKGITSYLTLEEFVHQYRDYMYINLYDRNTSARKEMENMIKVRNENLKALGYNSLKSFVKRTSYSGWKAWYFRKEGVRWFEKLRLIVFPASGIKMASTDLVLIESTNTGNLYICSQLKEGEEDVGIPIFYLTVLFELTDFPKDIFKDLPSVAKIKVADMFSEDKVTLIEKLIGKKKAPKVEEPKPSIVIPIMQQLCKNDNKKHFPSTEVEFDETKYRLTPYEPWDITVDPFYKNSFLPKSSGVFVLLNDSFVNEPMRAMATTEGAFTSIPDYMMEGVGQDGQYISNGNANGHIILKRKNVYLFYRDTKGGLRFFDSATYWGHSEQRVSTRPVLHIYLRSLLRKNGVK